MDTPLDVLHDKCYPPLWCISFPAGASFYQGGLVGGWVELGQVFLPWNGQRDILEVLQGHRHLMATEGRSVMGLLFFFAFSFVCVFFFFFIRICQELSLCRIILKAKMSLWSQIIFPPIIRMAFFLPTPLLRLNISAFSLTFQSDLTTKRQPKALTRSQVRHCTELTMVPSNTSEIMLRYFFWRLFFGGENVVTAVRKQTEAEKFENTVQHVSHKSQQG